MRLVRNKVLKATGIFKFKCDKYVKSVIEVLSIGGPRLYCFSGQRSAVILMSSYFNMKWLNKVFL